MRVLRYYLVARYYLVCYSGISTFRGSIMAKLVRSSFTLPADLLKNLAFCAARTGVSRSALLANLLGEPLADVRALLESLPPNPAPDDVLRLRGKSEEVVNRRLENLRDLDSDLFADGGVNRG